MCLLSACSIVQQLVEWGSRERSWRRLQVVTVRQAAPNVGQKRRRIFSTRAGGAIVRLPRRAEKSWQAAPSLKALKPEP